MISAPRAFCTRTDDSGVNSMLEESKYDRNTTPFSLVDRRSPLVPCRALRFFNSRPSDSAAAASENT
eukprot:scaffold260797_cov34-Tisochrysis_lutea.AAC.2